MKRVGKTFAGIEIVHFCTNDLHREIWNKFNIDQKLGVVVFWMFIVPKILEVMQHIGCEYIFLFAALNLKIQLNMEQRCHYTIMDVNSCIRKLPH